MLSILLEGSRSAKLTKVCSNHTLNSIKYVGFSRDGRQVCKTCGVGLIPTPDSKMDKMQNIAVVEDDDSVRALICFKLRNSGFNCVEFVDGGKFLDYMKTNHKKIDLVLLDLIMPLTTGTEVLIKLKEGSKTKHIPVIVLTAKTREKDVVDHLSFGATDFIKKPFSPQELIARIKVALRKCEK